MNRKILILSLCISHNALASMKPLTDGLSSAAGSARQLMNEHPYLSGALAAGGVATAAWLVWPKAKKSSSVVVTGKKLGSFSDKREVLHSPVDHETLSEALGAGHVQPNDQRRVSFASEADIFGDDAQDPLDQGVILARCEGAIQSADDEVAKQLEMLFITHRVLEKLLQQEEPFSLVAEQRTSDHQNGALYWASQRGRGDLMRHIVKLDPREVGDLCKIINATLLDGATSGVRLKPLMVMLGFEYQPKQQISTSIVLEKMNELFATIDQA